MAATPFNRQLAYWPGVASAVLGSVGLLLFFLPVLGIPLAGVGLILGLIALLTALFGARSSLRWSVFGLAISVLALVANLAITYAPVNSSVQDIHGRLWQPPPNRSYVSPPADPRLWLEDGNH
jgi:hypothetical protein